MSKKLTFLDTGVLISAMCGEEALALRCFSIIDDPEREFVVSDLLRLELLPKPTFNKKSDCVDFYTDYFNSTLRMFETNAAITARAFDLACKYGLGAVDAIHFQTAIEANVVEFITTEKVTKPFFKINHPTVSAISLR